MVYSWMIYIDLPIQHGGFSVYQRVFVIELEAYPRDIPRMDYYDLMAMSPDIMVTWRIL